MHIKDVLFKNKETHDTPIRTQTRPYAKPMETYGKPMERFTVPWFARSPLLFPTPTAGRHLAVDSEDKATISSSSDLESNPSYTVYHNVQQRSLYPDESADDEAAAQNQLYHLHQNDKKFVSDSKSQLHLPEGKQHAALFKHKNWVKV